LRRSLIRVHVHCWIASWISSRVTSRVTSRITSRIATRIASHSISSRISSHVLSHVSSHIWGTATSLSLSSPTTHVRIISTTTSSYRSIIPLFLGRFSVSIPRFYSQFTTQLIVIICCICNIRIPLKYLNSIFKGSKSGIQRLSLFSDSFWLS